MTETVPLLETMLRWGVAAAALVVLATLVHGIVRAQRQAAGRTVGRASRALRAPVQASTSLALLVVGILLSTLVGALLAVSGLALVAWGRLALGELYDVSGAAGARLRPSHRLTTSGPYAWVRHPMYVGVEVAAIGGLLLYLTWTLAFLVVAFLGLALRAAREDEVLRLEFGDEWEAYRDRVPAWLPRVPRPRIGRSSKGLNALSGSLDNCWVTTRTQTHRHRRRLASHAASGGGREKII